MYQYQICFSLAAVAILMISLVLDQYYLIFILVASAFAWLLTNMLVPKIAELMLDALVFGFDINKKGSEMG